MSESNNAFNSRSAGNNHGDDASNAAVGADSRLIQSAQAPSLQGAAPSALQTLFMALSQQQQQQNAGAGNGGRHQHQPQQQGYSSNNQSEHMPQPTFHPSSMAQTLFGLQPGLSSTAAGGGPTSTTTAPTTAESQPITFPAQSDRSMSQSALLSSLLSNLQGNSMQQPTRQQSQSAHAGEVPLHYANPLSSNNQQYQGDGNITDLLRAIASNSQQQQSQSHNQAIQSHYDNVGQSSFLRSPLNNSSTPKSEPKQDGSPPDTNVLQQNLQQLLQATIPSPTRSGNGGGGGLQESVMFQIQQAIALRYQQQQQQQEQEQQRRQQQQQIQQVLANLLSNTTSRAPTSQSSMSDYLAMLQTQLMGGGMQSPAAPLSPASANRSTPIFPLATSVPPATGQANVYNPGFRSLDPTAPQSPEKTKDGAANGIGGHIAVTDESIIRHLHVPEPFPVKLYRMLLEVERDGRDEVISFTPSGQAFAIHDPETFMKDIAPNYFKFTSVTSFKRQLYLYSFARVNGEGFLDAFANPLFQRGRPDLLSQIHREDSKDSSSKKAMKDSNKKKKK